jgi:hypothetical protein
MYEVNEAVKYFGDPLRTGKLVKMKFNAYRIECVLNTLDSLKDSGLKITQALSAIITFILLKLDDTTMKRVISKVEIRKVDNYVRKIINDKMRVTPLSKDLFDISWKYGVLCSKNLNERHGRM